MSGDTNRLEWQPTKQKKTASMCKEQEAGKELLLKLERDSLHQIERSKTNGWSYKKP